jgi:hypothetical protein
VDRRRFLSALPAAAAARAADPPAETAFDGSRPGPPVRPLHGVNGGPLAVGGTLDVSARWKEAGFPLARLHDCRWPNPDVVDVQAVFPDPAADPDRPESYDFARTDEYVAAVLATGAEVVFRLGEGIEHQRVKRHARPPRDPARWAAACVGIARHYNDPGELVRRAAGVRAFLDRSLFTAAESHLNEWNHLPGNDWAGMLANDPEARERWYGLVGGVEGEAFAAAALCRLQDAPVDAANYFTAEPGGMGLFNSYGVPTAAFAAFRGLARRRPRRTPAGGRRASRGNGGGRGGVDRARRGGGAGRAPRRPGGSGGGAREPGAVARRDRLRSSRGRRTRAAGASGRRRGRRRSVARADGPRRTGRGACGVPPRRIG